MIRVRNSEKTLFTSLDKYLNMVKWYTKSGSFSEREMKDIDTYLKKQDGVSKRELVRSSVLWVVRTDTDLDKCLRKAESPKKIMSGNFTLEEVRALDTYLNKHKLNYNNLIRGSVFCFVDSGVIFQKERVGGRTPTPLEIYNVLREIAGSRIRPSDKEVWLSVLRDSNNLEKLKSLFFG